jgi:hypothetical protein
VSATLGVEGGGNGRGGDGSELDPAELLGRALSLRLSGRLEALRIEWEDLRGGGDGGEGGRGGGEEGGVGAA